MSISIIVVYFQNSDSGDAVVKSRYFWTGAVQNIWHNIAEIIQYGAYLHTLIQVIEVTPHYHQNVSKFMCSSGYKNVSENQF